MEQQTPPQPRHRPRIHEGGRWTRRPARARRLILATGAAVLVITVGAALHAGAQAGSAASPARPTARTQSTATSQPTAAAAAKRGVVPPAATPTAATPTAVATPQATPPVGIDATAAPSGDINAALDNEINSILNANSQYQIGVALVSLSGGAGQDMVHQYGVQDTFEAGSTAKVLAAAAYYHLVETGGASLDDPMGSFTAGFQIQEMVQDSDNDSWSLVMDAIGHQELSDYAGSIGVTYSPESNTLTPAAMASVLSQLYTGQLLNPADTAELLSYMQDTNYETLIPAAVPPGVTVYHKYGLLDGELHDAGILTKGDNSYALVIYTKSEDLSDLQERTDVIHQLTQAVVNRLF
jgi:beta-lactamase class A